MVGKENQHFKCGTKRINLDFNVAFCRNQMVRCVCTVTLDTH